MKPDTTKKVGTKKATAKAATVRKPRVAAKKQAPIIEKTVLAPAAVVSPVVTLNKPTIADGRYVFATGRRKTAVANVRLFAGSGELLINKKSFEKYFYHQIYRDEVLKPLDLTGLGSDFYFTASINGGGIHSQAQALRHGIAQALAHLAPELRLVLKKNTFLTRDDRKKERKKPGLKRARRAPQWAKR